MSPALGDLMKHAQAMQATMQKAQEELAHTEVCGHAGGGLVSVTMTGRHDVRKVRIDPELMGDQQDVLEDLIAAAVNDAVHKVEALTREKMGGLAAGISMPDLSGLPLGG